MTQIRLRQDTATNWSSSSSITPALGEPCMQTDGEKYFKIGDGTNKFNNLPHFVQSTELGDLDDLTTENKDTFVDAINEIVANGADKDLSNLTATGENKLQAVKAYANEGGVLTDPDGFAFVEKYAHSTFDRSKFTVVGSPTITSDGVASGFSSSNGLTCGSPDFKSASTWEWVSPLLYNTSTTGGNDEYVMRYLDSTGAKGMFVRYASRTLTMNIALTVDDANYSIQAQITNLDNSKWYQCKIKYTGTKYEFYYRVANGSWAEITPNRNSNLNFTETLTTMSLGRFAFGATYAFHGDMDLKYLSWIIDGVEVFSGNKTGIDTIKPDDYTTVPSVSSTVTVTSDGLLTSSDASNYLQSNDTFTINGTNNKTLDIYFRFKMPDEALSSAHWLWNLRPFNAYINTSGKLNISGFENVNYYLQTDTLIYGQTYDVKYSVDYENLKLTGYIKTPSDTGYTQFATRNDITSSTYGNIEVNNRNCLFGAAYWAPEAAIKGGIEKGMELDLNSFKIYVDGNLVYQPCLKIPYTESKTGSKIVDSIYRDRVADMSAQFGYANYYTLSDTDFTLPQVELYGLIGQRTLRDSYRNGINYWELYSNRDLEQGGSCTSGVEIQFARPFADTNYILSVPYQAGSKTTDSFIPTQTGDWIAKGKGVL